MAVPDWIGGLAKLRKVFCELPKLVSLSPALGAARSLGRALLRLPIGDDTP